MENLKDQIFQATSDFLSNIHRLTEQHAAHVLQESFSALGGSAPRAPSTSSLVSARGAKRGADELERLSARFVQFVHENPGLRIEQINKQLGTTTPALALPIRKLVSNGDITTKGQKRSTTYFSGKAASASDGKDKDAGGNRKKSSRVRAKSKSKSKN